MSALQFFNWRCLIDQNRVGPDKHRLGQDRVLSRCGLGRVRVVSRVLIRESEVLNMCRFEKRSVVARDLGGDGGRLGGESSREVMQVSQRRHAIWEG